MKIVMFLILIFMLFAVSCGDDDDGNTGNTGETADTGDSGTDEVEADDTDVAEAAACTNMSIIAPNPDYESYFALNIVAEINPFGGSNEMTEAEYKKFNIKISGQENTELADSFVYASLNESGESLYISVFGDKGDNESEYNTAIGGMIPISFLKKMKTDGVNAINAGPYVVLHKIIELPDNVVKSCMTGMSDVSQEGSELLGLGKMEVCLEENENFTAGEFIKLGLNVKMIADPQEVANKMGTGDPEEMCNCFNMETEDEVDCP